MFENLSDKLDRAFKILKGQGKISEVNVSETLKEVRKALLDADVNFKVAKTFTDEVKLKAMGQNVLTSLSPGQLLIKITHDELAKLMGGEKSDIKLGGNPTVILMSGLQGSGKTTFTGKLGLYLKTKKGKKPLLVACDIYRPAAIDQLHVLGEQIGVDVFSDRENKDAVSIAKKGIQYARDNGNSVVIIDTAGRLAVDEQMMNEIAAVKKAVDPDEILFVVDAMTGQDAVNTAKTFNERLDFDGVILTKLDGDTRGGAALSIRSVVNKPIKFVGTGEKMDALDVFYPERMADRILGMGDVVTLVERAQEQYDEVEAKRLQKKIAKNQFSFNDFLSQLQQIKKMGNLKDLVGMIPGVGKALKDVDIKEDAFKSIEAIIHSMTPHERENPDSINGSRKQRIAKGSGTNIQEVNKLMKQFEDTRKMMKMMSNKDQMMKMMRNMPKQGR
ncbi:MAG TPA: signal recognition particle protein [Bacteroidia bacterium]|jgi:signal recognition particle subunit SRP54|nr:signal recognition particle protein [Bacteroidia bacterium]